MLSAELDRLETEEALHAGRQALLRRLIASDILLALSELSSPRKRKAAVAYLLSSGRDDLKALGIQGDRLEEIIDNPPPPGKCKVSNGRRGRTRIHGEWLRKPGRERQEQVATVL